MHVHRVEGTEGAGVDHRARVDGQGGQTDLTVYRGRGEQGVGSEIGDDHHGGGRPDDGSGRLPCLPGRLHGAAPGRQIAVHDPIRQCPEPDLLGRTGGQRQVAVVARPAERAGLPACRLPHPDELALQVIQEHRPGDQPGNPQPPAEGRQDQRRANHLEPARQEAGQRGHAIARPDALRSQPLGTLDKVERGGVFQMPNAAWVGHRGHHPLLQAPIDAPSQVGGQRGEQRRHQPLADNQQRRTGQQDQRVPAGRGVQAGVYRRRDRADQESGLDGEAEGKQGGHGDPNRQTDGHRYTHPREQTKYRENAG